MDIAMATISASKLAISAYSSLFVALTFGNVLQYRTSDFKRFICNDLAPLRKHIWWNVGPVTPEFKRVKGAHPPRVYQQFSYVRLAEPLLDLAGISTELSGVITTRFFVTYTLEGVSAMPRGLHAMALPRIVTGVHTAQSIWFTELYYWTPTKTFHRIVWIAACHVTQVSQKLRAKQKIWRKEAAVSWSLTVTQPDEAWVKIVLIWWNACSIKHVISLSLYLSFQLFSMLF